MSCIYIYKGHTFNSEVEFDDFLLEKHKFEPILGDIVFSQSTAKSNTESKLIEVSKSYKELNEKMKKFKKVYDSFGEESVKQPPYIGVTQFLSKYENQFGIQLYPEFRPDEYWSRRFTEWDNGRFSDAELELFGLDPEHLPINIQQSQKDDWRKQMENKWENQAKSGSAVHEILKLCFTKMKNGGYSLDMKEDQLLAYIKPRLSTEAKLFIHSDDIINLVIKHAKQLGADIRNSLGGDVSFFPEFAVSQKINSDNVEELVGIIDLLIVDGKGKVHILDHKTSINNSFDSVRTRAFKYLMAVYQRMLLKHGINVTGGLMFISPIQLTNFRKEGDKFVYDGINSDNPLEELDLTTDSDRIWNNIDEFIPAPFVLDVSGEEVGNNVSEAMSKWVPNYESIRTIDEESVKEELEKQGLLKKNESGLFIYQKPFEKDTIISDDEADFIKKVLAYKQSLPNKRSRFTQSVKKTLKDAIKNGIQSVEFPSPVRNVSQSSNTWLKDQLQDYANGAWEVCDNQLLEDYGIIMVKTVENSDIPPRVDFIRVSTDTLDINFFKFMDKLAKKLGKAAQFRNQLSLMANFSEASDLSENSKSDALALLGIKGNIELIETMLILNFCSGLENCTIGRMMVVNPDQSNGIEVSNEELYYNFNRLSTLSPLPFNKFKDGTIKLASKYDIVRLHLYQLMYAAELHEFKDEYVHLKSIKSCKSTLDGPITEGNDEKIKKLQTLLENLLKEEVKLQNSLKSVKFTKDNSNQQFINLYNEILIAIALLKGVNFRQQLQDHDLWLESAMVMTKGISGSYLDNPGNLNSATLNLITKLVTEAYLNTRSDMQRDRTKIYLLVENLKKEKGMRAISENTFGNLTTLYENMYEYTNGEFLFKDPKSLHGAEREFLEFALDKINRDRFPNKSDEDLQEMRDNHDLSYFRVPLALGGQDSIASKNGLLAALKDKLSYLIPKVAYQRAREKVEGIFNAEEDDVVKKKSELLYEMTNIFDKSNNPEKRKNMILEKGVDKFEHNLETLLYKHMFAYSVQRNMDGVFPMIKAAIIHIANLGTVRNDEFSLDKQYAEEYIKNKILNQSIVEPNRQKLANTLNVVKMAASKLTLALAPVQMFYQPLQSLWLNISLMIRKPDGKDSFTFLHFKKAYSVVYSDLFHFSDKPTLCSSLNELYGINDMDMNVYALRLSTGSKGIWNLDNFLFKFATRPDYYNRFTIFLSLMQSDKCLEAHSMKEGVLYYDISKDGRFKDWWANKNGNSPEINRQRSLYYVMARLFVQEGAKNPDGTDFVLDMKDPMPLPRAYTNKDAEGMKSLADDIYGYYSHEKKSLVQSTLIGSLWLQFKTYWSGKKNQFFQSGGIRLRGEWVHYQENGKLYYYQTDDSGNIDYSLPPLAEDDANLKSKIAPVMLWKGRWQEGIMLTLSDMAKLMWDKKSFRAGWNTKWDNEDPMLQQVYRSNIKQMGYDLFMLMFGGCLLSAILGGWLDDLKKANKEEKDIALGLTTAAANIAVMSVKNSFLDFNIFDSVGTPVGQWTPFAYSWGSNQMKNWWNVATGDEDFWDGVVKSSGALKQVKPFLDVIKPEMFMTEKELKAAQ